MSLFDRMQKGAQLGFDFGGGGKQSAGPKPPGSGWESIPSGKRGGYRRKKGSRYEYWYPDGQGGSGSKKKKKKKKKSRETAKETRERKAAAQKHSDLAQRMGSAAYLAGEETEARRLGIPNVARQVAARYKAAQAAHQMAARAYAQQDPNAASRAESAALAQREAAEILSFSYISPCQRFAAPKTPTRIDTATA
jgi:hypothetical protein